ncbi:MAG: zinc ribbon domain-containing protein [Deltaproteobacteria bacterium]|nr:zinc ribbon domain-containing protein [Deltaproteobacteria bacterium]MBW2158690.1 zinc ribbon domain-containing protein [Deltaproteobacteria bacterium]MBW2374520.1 zinc ribbon domain-containing protein [Deltaproteobacteria bacterium]MBW2587676.1 zinc ribbon domain-containing protein [Deltaproteobacteria bacterium]
MDCPQCGAEVPSDDSFCGKCGYARRDHGPERLDQSRIRMHEEREPAAQPEAPRSSSQQRIRKHTVLGMPSAAGAPPAGSPAPPSAPAPSAPPPPPPAALTSRRSGRTRTPQKTMLGIPRPDFPEPPAEAIDTEQSTPAAVESDAPAEPATPSHRTRARVRYDSANEPLPMIHRRNKALRGLALLVLLAAAWLGYRFLTLNG